MRDKERRTEAVTLRETKTKRRTEGDLMYCSLLDYRIQSTDGVIQYSRQEDLRIGKIP